MKILVVAPHPDDELLGCGGTLLKKASEGHTIGWLIVTSMHEKDGWPIEKIKSRSNEIEEVRKGLQIEAKNLFQLNFPTAQLDTLPMSNLIKNFSDVFNDFQPDEVFLPHPGDVHSDHRVCFEASMACTKWFRYPSVKRVLTYETISETDAMLDSTRNFKPTLFVNISMTLSRKWELLQIYKSEMQKFPFPRSKEVVNSLARFRGSQSGFQAAEAFCILREREDNNE